MKLLHSARYVCRLNIIVAAIVLKHEATFARPFPAHHALSSLLFRTGWAHSCSLSTKPSKPIYESQNPRPTRARFVELLPPPLTSFPPSLTCWLMVACCSSNQVRLSRRRRFLEGGRFRSLLGCFTRYVLSTFGYHLSICCFHTWFNCLRG